MCDKYAVLMETSGPDYESWYYFIKYEGNEEALKYINDQLNEIVDDVVYEDMSKFDIDLVNLVSLECVNQMIMLELNSVTYHRRFDGKLQMIDFGFKKKDKDTKRLLKVDETIGNNLFENFIEDEFIPETHRPTDSDFDSDNDSISSSGSDNSRSESKLDLPSSLKIN